MQFLDLNIIVQGIRTLMAMLSEFIYRMIAWFFNLFMNVAKVNILSSEEIQPIYQRVTMILTIVMIFYVTFEFVKFVVQPDGITDKEKGVGNIVYKMILVVVLIAFVPTIFTWAYKLQTAIIDKGVIGKVIIGDSKAETSQFGYTFSANLLSMFYSVDDAHKEVDCDGVKCGTLVQMNLGMLAKTGELEYLTLGINESKKLDSNIDGEKIETALINFSFHGFLPVVVGIVVMYILALYCVDVGVRWAQLIFLQIIAPIPIIGYLSPKKDGIFQKWCKQCLTTYLDIFIRIAIMYFILLICSILMTARTNGTMFENIDPDFETFVYIVLILGVLLFASKAPKLLKELFPSSGAASGNFGLKAGERVAPLAARAIGMGLGATRAVGGAIARAHNRHARNKANKAKPNVPWSKEGKEQARQRQEHRNAARKAGQDTKSAEKARTRVTDEELAAGKKKVQDAKANLEKAKLEGDDKKIAAAEAKLKTEASNYRKLVQDKTGVSSDRATEQRKAVQAARKELDEAVASGDEAKIKQSQDKLKQVTEEYRKAQSSGADRHMADVKTEASAAGSALTEAKAEEKYAESKLAQEEANLQKLRDDGADPEKIKAAEAVVENEKQNVEAKKQKVQEAEATAKEKAKLYKDIAFGGEAELTELKGKHEDALSQVAEDNNTKYGSVLGAGAWGAIAGGVTGAWHGAKATKLEDVWSKAKEGHQADVKNIQELNKYYDNGGNVGAIAGTYDRTVAKIQKSIGMDTAYTRTNLETQSLAADIKKYDETISRADSTKKAFDATEDRIKAKLGESKFTATRDYNGKDEQISTGLFERDEKGEYILGTDGKPKQIKETLKKGERIADLTRRYKSQAATARATADQVAKQHQDFKTTNAELLAIKDRSAVPAERLAEYDKVKAEEARLAEQVRLTSQDATEAEFASTQVDKNAARFLFTQMLKGETVDMDAVALENLRDLRESVRIASQDVEIRESLRSMAQKGIITLAEFNAFLSGSFENYDQLDHVNAAVTNAKNEIARTKQGVQDRKTRLESSNVTQAQKAANDYTGGSGK